MSDLIQYGAQLDSIRLRETIAHIFKRNERIESETGQRGTPICIWGSHGLGKTTLVSEFARQHNWKLAYCAPAQFEEMGDLHGLPTRVDPDPTVVGDEYTTFLPPDWVPSEEGPGILLLDDINRADDRILRGLMQLLQNFELFSWSLPKGWQIVATANPEGGDYSVTPMDDAMLTRMLHFTMIFDVKAWAAWALEHGVDPRGIDFVLTYPETVNGIRTTPRTLTQFFEQISDIEDLRSELDLVSALAMSSLDDVTVATFVSFVNDNLSTLIGPEEILEADDFKAIAKRIDHIAKGEGDEKRVDRLATICTRLFLHLTSPRYEPDDKAHKKNLIAFLMHDTLPNDLRFSLHRDLVAAGPKLKGMLRDKKLAKLMLDGM
ncbi:MAG: AAA family ATPase [Myxococcota bacterium]